MYPTRQNHDGHGDGPLSQQLRPVERHAAPLRRHSAWRHRHLLRAPRDDAADDDGEDKAFVRDTLRFFEFDASSFSSELKDAIRYSHLRPYKIYVAQSVKTAGEGGFEVNHSELDWSAVDAEAPIEVEQHFGTAAAITLHASARERRVRVPERDRVIMREHAQTLAQGYVDSRGVLRKLLLGKDIVFAVNKRHAETLAALFGAQFARFRPSPAKRFADDAVASDHGAVSEVDDMTKIRRFKKGTVTALMANAFDAPEPQCSTR